MTAVGWALAVLLAVVFVVAAARAWFGPDPVPRRSSRLHRREFGGSCSLPGCDRDHHWDEQSRP